MNTVTPGNVALVTGGASGIGAATVRRLSELGMRVVVADVDVAGGRAAAAAVDGLFVHTDVGSPEDNHAMVAAAVEAFGRLDVAFLNAGVGGDGNLLQDLDVEAYRAVRSVNFDGVVYGVHAVRRQFRAQGSGAIVVSSSLAGLYDSPFDPLYAATKHAVVGLVRSLAHSLAEENVTVNALCPAFVDTPLLHHVRSHLLEAGVEMMHVDAAAGAVETILADGGTGQAWQLFPDSQPMPFAYPEFPDQLVPAGQEDNEVSQ